MAAVDHRQPPEIVPVGADAARAGADVGAPLGRIERIGDHQPRIVHHAVGIFERGTERPLQRVADRMMGDVNRQGRRQIHPRRQPVVQQQPGPQQPGRALVGMRGDHEPRGAHQMRRDPQPDVTLGQLTADAQQAAALQHREIAMDQPRGRRRRAAAEVALFEQDDPQAATGGIARHADAVETAADDRKVIIRHAPAIAFSGDAITARSVKTSGETR